MIQTLDLFDVGARTRVAKDRKPGRADLALWQAARQDVLPLPTPAPRATQAPPPAKPDPSPGMGEGPWPVPGTLIPKGTIVLWTGKGGSTVSGTVADTFVRRDGTVMCRAEQIERDGKTYEGNHEALPHNQSEVTIDHWPGGIKTVTATVKPAAPPRFTFAPDKKHKFAFAVFGDGKRIGGNMSRNAAKKEAARMNQDKELRKGT